MVMSRIRELSADEEIRRLAFVRERALRDGGLAWPPKTSRDKLSSHPMPALEAKRSDAACGAEASRLYFYITCIF